MAQAHVKAPFALDCWFTKSEKNIRISLANDIRNYYLSFTSAIISRRLNLIKLVNKTKRVYTAQNTLNYFVTKISLRAFDPPFRVVNFSFGPFVSDRIDIGAVSTSHEFTSTRIFKTSYHVPRYTLWKPLLKDTR